MTTLAVEQLLCHHAHFGGQEGEQEEEDNVKHDNGSSTKHRKSSFKFVFNLWWTSFFTIFILTLGENLTFLL